MTKQPAIVTEGWTEVSDRLSQTGFFEEDQLNPKTVPRILGHHVRRYSAIIGFGDYGKLNGVGTGTFLRRPDLQPGILTAGHVIGGIKKKKEKTPNLKILVFADQDRECGLWNPIEGAGMGGCGERNVDGSKGPDIGWIPLSEEEVKVLESRSAVFYNMTKENDLFEGEVCQIGIIFGYVEAVSSLEQEDVIANGLIICKTREIPPDQDGWDYDEYAIRNDDPWIPRTHGGLSGSPVWGIYFPMDGSGRKAIVLEGVVFAEGPSEDRKLIAHGNKSLQKFLSKP